MVGANHVAYTDRFHELAKLVPHMVTPNILQRRVSRRLAQSTGWLAPLNARVGWNMCTRIEACPESERREGKTYPKASIRLTS
ncbi:hypothetical protein Tco_0876187 [Tanacetum coccineum]|uniref:Reverse transcriptase domain-containing protein n=1 Tax=Tanacetum coccineum TaxID=301880 RepID=A0ABQ5BRL3_9ASTR